MRKWTMVALLGVVAFTGMAIGQAESETGASAPHVRREIPAAPAPASSAFAGQWEACEGTHSAEECSRYVLLQRDDRICGTWSYFASGELYEGRIIAHAISPTEARRTHICGRPGSETDTPCEDGWQPIDKPLRLCDGKLGDLTRPDGSCFADHQRVPLPNEALDALQVQPWVEECLSRTSGTP